MCRAAASLPKGAKEQPRADGTRGREQGLPPCARVRRVPGLQEPASGARLLRADAAGPWTAAATEACLS